MKYTLTIIIASLVCVAMVDQAAAGGFGSIKGRVAYRNSQTEPWHAGYYDAAWGMPLAVVVPPTAENQSKMGWGVGNTRVVPIDHQFGRHYPGEGTYNRAGFRPTPRWPSDTDQFGDYYIRGPW
jgi:hypothetical protein